MVTDNHFVSDFFHLNEIFSCFEIPFDLSFHDGEFIFHKLLSRINTGIKLTSLFLTVSNFDNVAIAGTGWDNRIGMKVLSDQSMNCFRVISFIHDVTIGLSGSVLLSEEFLCAPCIVDSAVRGNKAGNYLLTFLFKKRDQICISQ